MQIARSLVDVRKGGSEFNTAAVISQALTLMQECLFIFSTCKNLYLTNINEELKDEVSTKRAATSR